MLSNAAVITANIAELVELFEISRDRLLLSPLNLTEIIVIII
jgi:hypothetical protein